MGFLYGRAGAYSLFWGLLVLAAMLLVLRTIEFYAWPHASAQILAKDQTCCDAEGKAGLVIRLAYEAADGRPIRTEFTPEDPPGLKVGDVIAIAYDPQEPTKFFLLPRDDWWRPELIVILLSILGILWIRQME